MAAVVCGHIERIHNSKIQPLVTRAELRALQAQINPHFFFNALNTICGSIPRRNSAPRKLVIGLADLFRISFAAECALKAEVTVLSIQPLVENAVKHGVAPRHEGGFVRLWVRAG